PGPDRRPGGGLLRQGLRRGLPGQSPLGTRHPRPRVRAGHDRADGGAGGLLLLHRAGPGAGGAGPGASGGRPGGGGTSRRGGAGEVPDAEVRLAELAPLGWVSVMGLLLVAALLVGAVVLLARVRAGPVGSAGTWGCGYAAPSPVMQYTSSSFAQTLVGLFAW